VAHVNVRLTQDAVPQVGAAPAHGRLVGACVARVRQGEEGVRSEAGRGCGGGRATGMSWCDTTNPYALYAPGGRM
jgi:hypothetical protein